MRLHDIPRHPLTFGPSPLQHLPRLSAHLGGAQVWAKREDVNSGLAFGGNKIRKLEYIVPDVLASGADTLVSIGGYQSNHTRQVAAVAAHLGLKCRLVQEKWVPWDDPVNDKVGNILLSRMIGADDPARPARLRHRHPRLVEGRAARGRGERRHALPDPCRGERTSPRRSRVRQLRVRARRAGEGARLHFDTVVVCTVTCSTHAGMVAGFAALEDLTGVKRRVIGIDASATLETTRASWSGSPATPPRSSSSAAICATTSSPCSRAGPATSTASHRLDDGSHAARRRARGDDHRPGLRGEVARRPGRPRP